MEKRVIRFPGKIAWSVIFASLPLLLFMIWFQHPAPLYHSSPFPSSAPNEGFQNTENSDINSSAPTAPIEGFQTTENSDIDSSAPTAPIEGSQTAENDDIDSCFGRYIYIHRLPRKYNQYLLTNCVIDTCKYLSNYGFGPPIANTKSVLQNTSWFITSQFALGVIFHNRMKHYECLTHNSSLASAVYVPFYAGIDLEQLLLGFNVSTRDSNPKRVVKWLAKQPEWKSLYGADHFLALGRISWDFLRSTNHDLDWGNIFLRLPESRNMTFLSIESSPTNSNDFAIPYPTYFHPSSDEQVFEWQNRMRHQKREYLFSFAGGQRSTMKNSVRSELVEQCQASSAYCKFLNCSSDSNCYDPPNVMKLFQSSHFCLQPPGDSYTRKSAFDSIVAGCIPVFFHPGSAYVQYLWYLPKNYSRYSVFIPDKLVRQKSVSIEKVLLGLSKEEISGMREEVIRLIPKVIYADPSSRRESFDDAFDIAVKRVLERIETIRRGIREGKSRKIDFPEEKSWKYYLTGTVQDHEWDSFFQRK
ncbi:Exostosin, GT47 domain [Dillenia turbinata]|uniref:Exostosin, GT47 domain n=1 Tax=Dillenia turbinata TaxID=194707 RepID=A0AAN8VQR4_9MAGN